MTSYLRERYFLSIILQTFRTITSRIRMVLEETFVWHDAIRQTEEILKRKRKGERERERERERKRERVKERENEREKEREREKTWHRTRRQ